MKENFNDKLKLFTEKAKALPAQTKLQEVKPVEQPNQRETETQLNVMLPKSLLQKLKIKALERDITLKELVESFLNKGLEIQ